jgi:hypothetical protein
MRTSRRMRFACWVTNTTDMLQIYTQIRNTPWFFRATMVARTCLYVTYTHISCLVIARSKVVPYKCDKLISIIEPCRRRQVPYIIINNATGYVTLKLEEKDLSLLTIETPFCISHCHSSQPHFGEERKQTFLL